jgi:hypothetical protein
LPNLLQTLFRRKGEPVIEQCVLSYLYVRSAVLGNDFKSISTLKVGLDYRHGIELYGSEAPWPVPVVVRSQIVDETAQIKFRPESAAWDFTITVLPRRKHPQQNAVIDCHERVSGQTGITSIVTRADTGEGEAVDVELEIE